MFHFYPCQDPECKGHERMAVFFARTDEAKFGYLCFLCYRKLYDSEKDLYDLYEYGVHCRAETGLSGISTTNWHASSPRR